MRGVATKGTKTADRLRVLRGFRSSRGETLRPVLVYVAAAVVYTWPLALHPVSHLAAPIGPGDPFLNLWILGWGLQSIVSDPMALVTGRVFDANIFHPAEGTLAFSDHLLLQSVVLAPLYAVTRDVVLCYNVLLFASLVASGLAMHAFVRAVTGSTGGACLAGLAWAFWPYRFAHLIHIQLQALYLLPLAFLFLHRLVAGRRRRDAIALGVVAGLQAWSSIYYGVIGAVTLAVGAVALAVAVGRWRSAAIARRLLLAATVGGVIVTPAALVYWRVQQSEGFGRNLYEASHNAADMRSYVRVPPGNVAYGRTGLLTSGGPERELFPGFVVLGLAVVGIALGRRSDARPLVTTMIAVAVVGFVLSLGPGGFRDLYALLQRYVFGFQAIRAPARFGVLVMFALATLAAVGWRELRTRDGLRARGSKDPRLQETRTRSRGSLDPRIAMLVLIVLAGFEYLNVPMPLTTAPPRETGIGQWLKREPGDGSVVHLPLALDVENTPAMLQSLEHRRPLVNGYSGQRPAFYAALVDTLSAFPGDEALVALHEIGVRFVVTPEAVAARDAADAWPLVERARLAEGIVYELRWTDEFEDHLDRVVAVTPEPPGPSPFAAGETARYVAHWAGGAMNVPAGEITVTVGDPAHTFVVSAETAPWVARFFEARDVFTTRANSLLLPELHVRDQQEGSRHVTRAFVYAHEEGLVRLGRDAEHALGEEGVSLPLQPLSRDAITALFYARTLPLEPGRRYLIPVNEAGRNLMVELTVAGRETIEVQGRRVPAIRLDPRIRRRVERRRPVTATIWVSDDARKVPVALDLDAGFGRVRLELAGYEP